MIRIVLADDHPVVRAGIRALVGSESDFTVVGEAATGAEAVSMAEQLSPDVVLIDLQFRGGLHGAEATRLIRAADDAPHVLVLTNYDTDGDILGAIEAGASGYLLKDAPPAELISAIRAAAAGESALAPTIASRLDRRAASADSQLTRREIDVLDRVGQGRSNREIGHELFLTEATVKSHLVHIFTKLGVSSRTSAVAAGRQLRII